MNSTSATELLAESGWEKAALQSVLDATLRNGGRLDPVAFSAVASAAERREQEGHEKDAVRLAELALSAIEAGDPIEGEEAAAVAFMETLRWARYRLRALLLRQGVTKAHDALDEAFPIGAPVDARKLLAGVDAPAAVVERIRAGVGGAKDEHLADALTAISELSHELYRSERYADACHACRVGIEIEEKLSMVSEPAAALMGDLAAPLSSLLVRALGELAEEDEGRVDVIKWLLKSNRGHVRIAQLGFPLSEMKRRDIDTAVLRLKKSSAKSARAALLTVGEHALDSDAYLALCRELSFPRGIVSTLISRGQIDEAVVEARRAIAESDAEWELAKLFDAAGHTDVAIDLLRAVAEETVSTDLEIWLADRLQARGADEEVLALYRNRFTKRPALPSYQAIRERLGEEHWPAMRLELLEELRGRRLFRPMVDIAANERDVTLLASITTEIDSDQAEHVTHVLHTWLDGSSAPRPVIEKLLADLEKRTGKADVAPREAMAKAPVPKRVRHKKFGEGDVVGWSGERENRKLEIDFEEVGKKTLLAHFVEVIR